MVDSRLLSLISSANSQKLSSIDLSARSPSRAEAPNTTAAASPTSRALPKLGICSRLRSSPTLLGTKPFCKGHAVVAAMSLAGNLCIHYVLKLSQQKAFYPGCHGNCPEIIHLAESNSLRYIFFLRVCAWLISHAIRQANQSMSQAGFIARSIPTACEPKSRWDKLWVGLLARGHLCSASFSHYSGLLGIHCTLTQITQTSSKAFLQGQGPDSTLPPPHMGTILLLSRLPFAISPLDMNEWNWVEDVLVNGKSWVLTDNKFSLSNFSLCLVANISYGMDETLSLFVDKTGTDPSLARDLLETSKWDLDEALQAFQVLNLGSSGSVAAQKKPKVGKTGRGLSFVNSDIVFEARHKVIEDNIPGTNERHERFDETPNHTFILPDLSKYPQEFREFLRRDLVETSVLVSLEQAGKCSSVLCFISKI